MTAPEDPSRAELQDQIEDLTERSRVDRELIEQLRTEGDLERDKIENLETALVTCRRIGAAMGILMERQRFTEDQAFDALRAVSQTTHRKLRDVADHLLLKGALPGPAAP